MSNARRPCLLLSLSIVICLSCCAAAFAQDVPGSTASTAPARLTALPQKHEYQRVLRDFMATLTEKDFAHGVTGFLASKPSSQDPEDQYRQYIFTMMLQPMIGTKRGAPSVNSPARLFTLQNIETPEGVKGPPAWPESLIAFERWNYPGNPYHNNRALRLRSFVAAAVNLMMLDDYLDRNPNLCRSDYMGYKLVYAGVPYLGSKDDLPPEVQKAFETGLKRLGQRIIAWGPKGEEANLDMTAPVGLWYAAKACNDPEFTKQVEFYARLMLADPNHFHPAGYFIERGGLDVGFGGMANFFAAWLALASDWDFAKDAVDRAYRLRAHLILPEPDGKFTGPSHFNTRLGSPACADQWDWNFRDYAAAMITDEAAYLTKLPSAETLQKAALTRAGIFNHGLEETAGIRFKGAKAEDFERLLHSGFWHYYLWATYGFPASVNFGYEFYRKGAYAHRLKLETTHSPLLKSPFLRDENFIRDFADAFVVAKRTTYAAILHTGPVGTQDPDDGLAQFKGPMGFGGGELSAFWTPATGSIILGRRAGQGWDATSDKVDEWRTWPIHAVSGATAGGKFFTSARIVTPGVTADAKGLDAQVKVAGTIPARIVGQDGGLEGRIDYVRAFTVSDRGVGVETAVSGDGKDQVAELYETIPVFLREGKTAQPTTIEFLVGVEWQPATAEYQENVTAVKLTRFDGAVKITLDRRRRVKLSPQAWKDTYMTAANCRNVMIDLLENADKPAPVKDARKISYRVEAMAE